MVLGDSAVIVGEDQINYSVRLEHLFDTTLGGPTKKREFLFEIFFGQNMQQNGPKIKPLK